MLTRHQSIGLQHHQSGLPHQAQWKSGLFLAWSGCVHRHVSLALFSSINFDLLTLLQSIIEVSVTIICSCAPAIFSLARHIFSNSPFFASLRSRVTRTNDISPNYSAPRKATYTLHSLDSRPPHTKDNAYLELGEVADTERKLTGAAFGRGAGVPPPPARKATDYLREKQKEKGHIRKTTDVDITYPDNAFGSEGMRGFPENSFARQGPRGPIR